MFILNLLGALLIFGVMVLIFALIAIPVVLVVAMLVAAIKLALFIVLVPFRLIGWAFGLAVGR